MMTVFAIEIPQEAVDRGDEDYMGQLLVQAVSQNFRDMGTTPKTTLTTNWLISRDPDKFDELEIPRTADDTQNVAVAKARAIAEKGGWAALCTVEYEEWENDDYVDFPLDVEDE
jgi:hypothetical protein